MLEKINIVVDLLAFVLTFYNMYKMDNSNVPLERITHGFYMLFWLIVCLC